MSQIQSEAQSENTSAPLALFTLNAAPLGGPILRFVQSSKSASAIVFGGLTFTPADVKFEGMETSGIGALPTPTISLSNSDDAVQALVNTYGDMNGCGLTRIRTFKRFLDGEPEADPNAYYGPDIFSFEQKITDTDQEIAWALSAAIDQQGKMIPGRVMVRDTCLWRYRQWTGTVFDYTKALCPYAGAQAYDINDLPVANALDVPSRRKSCCKTRFGVDAPWPFGGFPGMARVR